MRCFIKKFGLIGILAAGLFLITGCGAKQDAGKAFEAMMQTLQSGDMEQVDTYYHPDGALINPETQGVVNAAVSEVLKKMQYRVVSMEKTDADHVSVTAEVTTVDLSKAVSAYLNEVIEMVSDADYQAKLPAMTQEEYQKLLADKMAEVIRRDDLGTEDKTLTLSMVKRDGVWVPDDDKAAFFEALFGNLMKAVASLA